MDSIFNTLNRMRSLDKKKCREKLYPKEKRVDISFSHTHARAAHRKTKFTTTLSCLRYYNRLNHADDRNFVDDNVLLSDALVVVVVVVKTGWGMRKSHHVFGTQQRDDDDDVEATSSSSLRNHEKHIIIIIIIIE